METLINTELPHYRVETFKDAMRIATSCDWLTIDAIDSSLHDEREEGYHYAQFCSSLLELGKVIRRGDPEEIIKYSSLCILLGIREIASEYSGLSPIYALASKQTYNEYRYQEVPSWAWDEGNRSTIEVIMKIQKSIGEHLFPDVDDFLFRYSNLDLQLEDSLDVFQKRSGEFLKRFKTEFTPRIIHKKILGELSELVEARNKIDKYNMPGKKLPPMLRQYSWEISDIIIYLIHLLTILNTSVSEGVSRINDEDIWNATINKDDRLSLGESDRYKEIIKRGHQELFDLWYDQHVESSWYK